MKAVISSVEHFTELLDGCNDLNIMDNALDFKLQGCTTNIFNSFKC